MSLQNETERFIIYKNIVVSVGFRKTDGQEPPCVSTIPYFDDAEKCK